MDERVNPYDPPASPKEAEESTLIGNVAFGWSAKQQPLSWKVSSVVGTVSGFAGVLIAIKYIELTPAASWLIFGLWMSLCLLPSSFFAAPRFVGRPVRNWLHALSPSLLILAWGVVSAAARCWGGESLATLAWIFTMLDSLLISQILSGKAVNQ